MNWNWQAWTVVFVADCSPLPSLLGSVSSMRSLLKLRGLKVLQLSEQAEVPVFWNTASGNKTDISICKSHFKCLRFVTWYVTWFWDIYQEKKKKKQIQQLVWELKLYSIPQWSEKFRDKQRTEPACLGVIWSSWGCCCCCCCWSNLANPESSTLLFLII